MQSKTRSIVTGVMAIGGLCLSAFAQSPPTRLAFYGVLDTAQSAAVKDWSLLLWSRIENGPPAAAASTFTFDDPALASPLFQPLRAAKSILESLAVAPDSDCFWIASTTTGSIVAVGDAAVIQAAKEYMILGRLSTDLLENPQSALTHLNKVQASANADVAIEGGALVSYGVEPGSIAAAYLAGQPKFDLAPGTLHAIGVILASAPAIAGGASGPAESIRAIRGGSSGTDEFLAQLGELLWHAEVDQVVVTRLDATFGAYGSLPLALVQFNDSYVLVDSVNGALAGPFEPASPFDATSLLANHSNAYQPGSAVVYVDDQGCETDVPKPLPPQLKIRCIPIMLIPGTPAVHCWIELEAPGPGGSRRVCGAHPQWPTVVDDPITEPPTSFPFGPIVVYCNTWEGSPEENFVTDTGDPLDGIRTTQINCPEGTDTNAIYDCISQVTTRIAACAIPYDAVHGPNSNTAVRVAVQYCVNAACCTMMSPGSTPRTSRGRIPVGWESEEGMRRLQECIDAAQPPIAQPSPPPPPPPQPDGGP